MDGTRRDHHRRALKLEYRQLDLEEAFEVSVRFRSTAEALIKEASTASKVPAKAARRPLERPNAHRRGQRLNGEQAWGRIW